MSWSSWYARFPMFIRDCTRVALGLLIALTSFVIFNSFTYLWPLLPASVALWLVFKHKRKQVIAKRCVGCPELGQGVCSGFAPHARAMRAIEAELEAELEARAGLFGSGN